MCLRRLKWPALDGLSFSYHFLLFENFVHACDGFFNEIHLQFPPLQWFSYPPYHISLPISCILFLNSLSPRRADCMCLGLEPSSRVQTTSHHLQPSGKLTSPLRQPLVTSARDGTSSAPPYPCQTLV